MLHAAVGDFLSQLTAAPACTPCTVAIVHASRNNASAAQAAHCQAAIESWQTPAHFPLSVCLCPACRWPMTSQAAGTTQAAMRSRCACTQVMWVLAPSWMHTLARQLTRVEPINALLRCSTAPQLTDSLQAIAPSANHTNREHINIQRWIWIAQWPVPVRQLRCASCLLGPSARATHCPLLLQVEAAAAAALAQAAANKAATPNPAEAAQKARAAVAPQATGGKLTPSAQAALDKAVYSL